MSRYTLLLAGAVATGVLMAAPAKAAVLAPPMPQAALEAVPAGHVVRIRPQLPGRRLLPSFRYQRFVARPRLFRFGRVQISPQPIPPTRPPVLKRR